MLNEYRGYVLNEYRGVVLNEYRGVVLIWVPKNSEKSEFLENPRKNRITGKYT